MINLYHLKYFCDACRSENMTESARLNRVSHSAVSQAIRSLESGLGLKLLRHSKKHFELTQEGAQLFAKAQNIFSSLDGLTSIGSLDELSGPLKIGLSHSIGLGLISEKLGHFVTTHSQVSPTVLIGNSEALERLLERREIEIGFGIEDGSFASYERQLLLRGKFILAATKDGEKSNNFIVGDKGFEVRTLLSHLKNLKIEHNIIKVQSWTMVADLVSRGLGTG